MLVPWGVQAALLGAVSLCACFACSTLSPSCEQANEATLWHYQTVMACWLAEETARTSAAPAAAPAGAPAPIKPHTSGVSLPAGASLASLLGQRQHICLPELRACKPGVMCPSEDTLINPQWPAAGCCMLAPLTTLLGSGRPADDSPDQHALSDGGWEDWQRGSRSSG